MEDARVGLADADRARVDHALDLDAEARTDLQHLLRGESLRRPAVGVRDDADAHAGRRRARAARRRAGHDARPQVADGELAVEVRVHFLADARVVADAGRR